MGKEMNVLIAGGWGGREYALAREISKSGLVKRIFCPMGNLAIGKIEKCAGADIDFTDIQALADFAEKNIIDLTIVGPETLLADGIVGEFEERKLRIFGPTKETAKLEWSKVFAKNFMEKHGISTAEFAIFDNPEEAKKYACENIPCVIKTDGLAAGKGVILCHSVEEAIEAIDKIMRDKAFGNAGDRIVIEEFLPGKELTFQVITDGETVISLLPSRDHKAFYNGGKGSNTGGMGAYASASIITDELKERIMSEVVNPTIEGIKDEGILYKGVLYFGLMINRQDIKVLEFNCRFGDPEIQAILPLIKSDIVPILEAVIDGNLSEEEIKWSGKSSVCVVMASKGYPGKPEIGKEIIGLGEAEKMEDVIVCYAGVKEKNGKIFTDGGRVLSVVGTGKNMPEARKLAYKAVGKISWEGAYYRTDIG